MRPHSQPGHRRRRARLPSRYSSAFGFAGARLVVLRVGFGRASLNGAGVFFGAAVVAAAFFARAVRAGVFFACAAVAAVFFAAAPFAGAFAAVPLACFAGARPLPAEPRCTRRSSGPIPAGSSAPSVLMVYSCAHFTQRRNSPRAFVVLRTRKGASQFGHARTTGSSQVDQSHSG